MATSFAPMFDAPAPALPVYDTEENKREFASVYLRVRHALSAAGAITSDPYQKEQIAFYWPNDPVVRQEIEALTKHSTPESLLPTKEEFANRLMVEAEQCVHKDTRLDYLKLAADVMGYIPKGGAVAGGAAVNVIVQSVMEVPVSVNEDEEDAWIERQQRKLIESAPTSHKAANSA